MADDSISTKLSQLVQELVETTGLTSDEILRLMEQNVPKIFGESVMN